MEAVVDYEDRLRKMQSLPRFSYGRGMLRKDGALNRIFLTHLFGHQELAIQFLKDVGLIQGKVQCNICERDMAWSTDPIVLKDLGGDVGRELLGPGAVGWRPSDKDHDSS